MRETAQYDSDALPETTSRHFFYWAKENEMTTTITPCARLRALLLPILVIMMVSNSVYSQSCDYLTGVISLSAQGQNSTDLYETRYVLTRADGEIIDIKSAPEFTINTMGFYLVYGVNYKKNTAVNDLSNGNNIRNVTGDCIDIGAPLPMTVCQESDPCEFCFGEEISLASDGDTATGFITKYVLTDQQGVIDTILDTPDFGKLGPGIYVAFAITYETSEPATGLQKGSNIHDIDGTCKDISNGYVIGVCERLSPKILFDLMGCNISETALLQVSGNYDSYQWSTGSTESFIIVDANKPATYTVTVRQQDGCEGVKSQVITGNEVARIGDYVWDDENNNGIQDSNESGLNGVRVSLYTDFNRDGRPDIPNFPSCTTTTTNHPTTGRPGYYNFTVYRGNYIVKFGAPQGYTPTKRNEGEDDNVDSDIDANGQSGSIGVTSGQVITDVDAGFFSAATLCGRVWTDANGDGVRENEEGVNDVTVYLYDAATDSLLMTTITADINSESGSYCFDRLGPGTYYVEIVKPDGTILTIPNQRLNDEIDSDATGSNGPNTTDDIKVERGVTIANVDFGIYTGGSVCGIVWKEDASSENGTYDSGVDSLISNSQIELVSGDGTVVGSASTDDMGAYCINDIPRGSYVIRPLASTIVGSYTMVNQGDDPLLDSDINPNTSRSSSFFVGVADTIRGMNAGLRSSTVPVELLTFRGKWDTETKTNHLQWETLVEINNEKYEIERAIGDDGKWEKIATVLGAGTTTQRSNYEYRDSHISISGTYYYRLRQVDYDGGYDYSDIIAIEVELNEPLSLNVYPNPANQFLVVKTKIENNAYYRAELYDLSGRRVYVQSGRALTKGTNAISIDVGDLHNGQYILHVYIGTQDIVQKVLIAR